MHDSTVSAAKECITNVASVLNETIRRPEHTTKFRKQIQTQKPTPPTPNEALEYIQKNSLTKQQYVVTRVLNISHHSNISLSYIQVIEAKTLYRQMGIEVTKTYNPYDTNDISVAFDMHMKLTDV